MLGAMRATKDPCHLLFQKKTKYLRDPRKNHSSIIKIAGLEYKCIHFLRHSWATNGYVATGDSMAIQELGGWRDHKSVEKYIKVSDKIKKQRIKQIQLINPTLDNYSW